MSESVVKQRQPVDLGEFERRLRGPDRARASADDPLAELARLVDKNDDPFATQRAAAPRVPAPEARHHSESEPESGIVAATARPDVRPADFDSRGVPPPPRPAHQPIEFREEMLDRSPAEFARDLAPPAYAQTQQSRYEETPVEPAPRKSRMGMYAMGGALAVVAVGVAGTFAMKSGPIGRGDAPLIRAATEPAKVQPDSGAAPTAAQNASVLDKNGDKLAASRVVGSAEQPVDLAAQARARGSAGPNASTPTAGSNIFPEPKRVKTVSVRPDGSIVGADIPVATTPPPARPTASAASPAPQASAAPTRSVTPTPQSATPAAQPKATTRVAARPTREDDDDDAPAKPAAAAKPTPKPVAAKPATTSAGGFAIQLGSAGSDTEARDKANRLQAKFGSSLDGRRPTVLKAEVNGKTVYRVRVVGLTQESATAMCGKVKGGGGDCFVAR